LKERLLVVISFNNILTELKDVWLQMR